MGHSGRPFSGCFSGDALAFRNAGCPGELYEIFVKFLPHWVSEKDVRGIFAECGEIVRPAGGGAGKNVSKSSLRADNFDVTALDNACLLINVLLIANTMGLFRLDPRQSICPTQVGEPRLLKNPSTGQCKGVGWVTFAARAAVDEALRWDGCESALAR